MKRTFKARLSGHGKIAALLGIALSSHAFAQNIIPANNAQTQVSQQNKVDVVNIATPNGQGLSHNQYNKFNVGTPGAVMNNSTQAGQSQLAGQLNANPNLNNGAAKVILNEVVKNNPSLLLGQQEVFGLAADYVLANPSGITCQGCGFINTPRATLVVGKPEISEGRLNGFAVGTTAQTGTLKATGTVKAPDTLDLIAPKVDINGNIEAANAINVESSRGHIAYADLSQNELTAKEKAATRTAAPLDGAVVGSMNSGKIRIHNGDTKATTRVEAELKATNSVDLQSAGTLNVSASRLSGQDINVAARDLTVNGKTTAANNTNKPKSTAIGNGVTRTESGNSRTETYTGTQIDGGKVSLSGSRSAQLSGTDIQADELSIKGGDVSLTTAGTTDRNSTLSKDSKILWYNQTKTDTVTETRHGNHINVKNNADIEASGSLNAQALELTAQNAHLSAGENLSLSGATAGKTTTVDNRYANQGADLKSGKVVSKTTEEQYRGSAIKTTGDVALSAKNISLTGSSVAGTDITVAGDKVTLGTQSTKTTSNRTDHAVLVGGFKGGADEGSSANTVTQYGSSMVGGNINVKGNNGIAITGSTLTGNSATLSADKGDVVIGNATNRSETLSNSRNGVALNITNATEKSETETDSTVASAITTQGGLNISGNNITVTGSSLTAGGKVALNAANGVTTHSDNALSSQVAQNYKLGANGYARQDGSKYQYIAGFDIQGVTHTTGTTTGKVTATTINGQGVSVNGSDVALNGTNINAGSDGVAVSGKKVALGADNAVVSGSLESTQTAGGGMYISAGLEKIALGIKAGGGETRKLTQETQAQTTRIQSGGNIALTGSDSLSQTGAQLRSQGNVSLNGNSITNQAAADTRTEKTVSSAGEVKLEGKVDVPSITKAQIPAFEIGLGINANGAGTTTVNSNAVVTQINGKAIDVAGKDVSDSGTRYQAAGDAVIHADNYTGTAAQNSQITTVNTGNGNLNLSAGSATMTDITIKGGLGGGYQYQQTGASQAVQGSIAGDNVRIQADNNLTSSMNVNAAHDAALEGKKVTITQADDKQWKTQGGFNAQGNFGITYLPETGVVATPSVAVKGGVNYYNEQNTTAKGASVKAGNALNIRAADAAATQGAALSGSQVAVTGKSVDIGAAYDSRKVTGFSTDADVKFSLTPSDGSWSATGIGAGGKLAFVSENGSQGHGGSIKADSVDVKADSATALKLTGTDVNANTVNLSNSGGNVEIENAAGHRVAVSGNIGGNVGNASSKGFSAAGFNAALTTDTGTSYQAGTLKAQNLNINAAKDLKVQGTVDAGTLKGNVGGNVAITSPQNSRTAFSGDTSWNVGVGSAISKQEVNLKDVVTAITTEAGKQLGIPGSASSSNPLEVTLKGASHLSFEDSKTTVKTRVNADSMDVSVGGGKVSVQAAQVSANSGSGFGSAGITKADNHDYTHAFGGGMEGELPNIPKIVKEVITGQPITSPTKINVEKTTWTDGTVETNVSLKK